jgi:HK97 gp10 family phage protein
MAAHAQGVKVVIDDAAVKSLLTTELARAATQTAGDAFAERARGYAARRTGAGAASIRARVRPATDTPAGFAARVSWDRPHYYMYMQEWGTVKMPAHPALQPALEDFPDSPDYAVY